MLASLPAVTLASLPAYRNEKSRRISGIVMIIMARPEGLEPSTYRSEVCCSIQLSYERMQ